MEKIDLTRQYKNYYKASAKPKIVQIEQAQFLAITGKGDPSGIAFTNNIRALYATAYVIKFIFKATGNDFTVAKLEGQW